MTRAAWRLGDLFAAPARRRPALPIRLDRSLSIAPALGTELRLDQLARLASETADKLRKAGVGPGDRVAIVKRPNLDISVLHQHLDALTGDDRDYLRIEPHVSLPHPLLRASNPIAIKQRRAQPQ